MHIPFLRIILAASAISLISACQPVAVQTLQPPSFAQMTPINLDVNSIEVVDEYRSPMAAPNVEQYFAVSPAQGIRNWTRDRLRATGHDRKLEVIIKDASVVEAKLPRTEGIKGAFTKDQAQRYDGRVEVELRVYGSRALSEASINAVASRSASIAENATVAEREKLFNTILTDLMTSLNSELEKNIYQYFGPYVNYNGTM